jgi:hypothetical protein
VDILIGDSIVALTANGTTGGFVTVADNSPFYPGAVCSIYGTTAAAKSCLIVQLSGATLVQLQVLPAFATIGAAPNYGASDMSAFTTADGAKIAIPAQAAPVQSANPVTKKPHA